MSAPDRIANDDLRSVSKGLRDLRERLAPGARRPFTDGGRV